MSTEEVAKLEELVDAAFKRLQARNLDTYTMVQETFHHTKFQKLAVDALYPSFLTETELLNLKMELLTAGLLTPTS